MTNHQAPLSRKSWAAVAIVLVLAVGACGGSGDGNGEGASSEESTTTTSAPESSLNEWFVPAQTDLNALLSHIQNETISVTTGYLSGASTLDDVQDVHREQGDLARRARIVLEDQGPPPDSASVDVQLLLEGLVDVEDASYGVSDCTTDQSCAEIGRAHV